MGREAKDVLASLKLSDEQKLDYDCVKNGFEKHFIPRRNIIYDRATFNRRKRETHERVKSFVTNLFKLAEKCQYGALKDELIRDRLVVGLLDTALSEKLKLYSALTLETTVTAARNSEAVKQQHKEMRGTQGKHGAAVDELSSARRKKTGSRKQRRRFVQKRATKVSTSHVDGVAVLRFTPRRPVQHAVNYAGRVENKATTIPFACL
ncbi:unnamed protein product [Ixodes pacificus]